MSFQLETKSGSCSGMNFSKAMLSVGEDSRLRSQEFGKRMFRSGGWCWGCLGSNCGKDLLRIEVGRFPDPPLV